MKGINKMPYIINNTLGKIARLKDEVCAFKQKVPVVAEALDLCPEIVRKVDFETYKVALNNTVFKITKDDVDIISQGY